MSYQQQQKTPFCALTIKMYATGKTAPKFEFKANAESLFTCSLTKKKYKLSQIDEWYNTEGVQNFGDFFPVLLKYIVKAQKGVFCCCWYIIFSLLIYCIF